MALRRPVKTPALVATDRLVRISEVLGEASGQPAGDLIAEAEQMAGAREDVVLDWAGRSCLTWAAAAALLRELKDAQASAMAERMRNSALADQQQAGLGAFVIGLERPGERPVGAAADGSRLSHGQVEGPR
jgi:hypothetical protein